MECEYCDSKFTVEEIEAKYADANKAAEEAKKSADSGTSDGTWSVTDEYMESDGMKTYECPQCGAIFCYDSIGSVLSCSFVNCAANVGGAVYCDDVDFVVNYNIFDNNLASTGSAIYTQSSIDCDFNFFAFENNITIFPKGLVSGTAVNKWVVLNISKDNSRYSVDFVCNDGSTLTKSMYDYAANLNINGDVKEIVIKNNTFKDEGIIGDYLLNSRNSGNVLARITLKWDTLTKQTL